MSLTHLKNRLYQLLQKAIHKINKYSKKWGLKLNVHKTKYMLIANNYKRISYELSSNLSLEINNQKIEKLETLLSQVKNTNYQNTKTYNSINNSI
ncbi:hypothetical protein BpHYR1_042361 [Brachionus plicatilis]|uniref:RNA-directed DNA polymerase from mobile element jockey-like n=1 Tax=Brachionus plicatilis TaxID=10195 RepID=A0A3M7SKA6_BRAPC|nr:hypothetical protein BpHYR1_042361 [Brachionus plicatilis]